MTGVGVCWQERSVLWSRPKLRRAAKKKRRSRGARRPSSLQHLARRCFQLEGATLPTSHPRASGGEEHVCLPGASGAPLGSPSGTASGNPRLSARALCLYPALGRRDARRRASRNKSAITARRTVVADSHGVLALDGVWRYRARTRGPCHPLRRTFDVAPSGINREEGVAVPLGKGLSGPPATQPTPPSPCPGHAVS